MDPERKLRYLIPPVFFILFLLFGIYFSDDIDIEAKSFRISKYKNNNWIDPNSYDPNSTSYKVRKKFLLFLLPKYKDLTFVATKPSKQSQNQSDINNDGINEVNFRTFTKV